MSRVPHRGPASVSRDTIAFARQVRVENERERNSPGRNSRMRGHPISRHVRRRFRRCSGARRWSSAAVVAACPSVSVTVEDSRGDRVEGGTVAVTVTGIPSRSSGMVSSTVKVSVTLPGPAPVRLLAVTQRSESPDCHSRHSPAPHRRQEPALQSCRSVLRQRQSTWEGGRGENQVDCPATSTL